MPEPVDLEAPRRRPKIRKLRLLGVLSGLGLLAIVSTVFGMMMAVASDLPRIEVLDVAQKPSEIVDRRGNKLGTLTSNQNRLLVESRQIAAVMKHAVVAIEDRRFYTNNGVDLRSIGRALYQDVIAGKAVQGGSTIAQQLVKNRLEAQSDRTLFQKAREAAIAFHMTRNWDKDKILTNYLNTIYFGNGAYGVEAAAKTYFGTQHAGCDATDPKVRGCAQQLEPHEAALLAGIIASPSGYDPLAHPVAATNRRDLVLLRMLEQGLLLKPEYDKAILEPVPAALDIKPPAESSRYPYFTTWVRQQVVDKVGPSVAFEGGLQVKTTIDPELQEAAEQAIKQFAGQIGYSGTVPAAALVALDNGTSEVLAMVGGGPETPEDPAAAFNARPFNLATQGQRQPGSSFKPFILAEALRQGIKADSVWTSRKKSFCVVKKKDGNCKEAFEVNNYEDAYAGVTTLARATTFSDNSVFAEVGLDKRVGTRRIARLARRMGIRTRVSTNKAMTLGGLKEGVTVLDMAHAYQTMAYPNYGKLVYGSLSPGVDSFERKKRNASVPGPVGILNIRQKGKLAKLLSGDKAENEREEKRIFSEGIGKQVEGILQGVVKFGTARRASLGPKIPVAGKTGTTEDYGDAWFVGWTPRYTIAVWVGFPDSVKAMKPENGVGFGGEPVAGGTFPAAIWQAFAKRAEQIWAERDAKKHPERKGELEDAIDGVPTGTPAPGVGQEAPPPDDAADDAPAKKPRRQPAPEEEAPEEQQAEPAPAEPEQDPGASGGAGAGTQEPVPTTPPPDEAGNPQQ